MKLLDGKRGPNVIPSLECPHCGELGTRGQVTGGGIIAFFETDGWIERPGLLSRLFGRVTGSALTPLCAAVSFHAVACKRCESVWFCYARPRARSEPHVDPA
jgi:hypothetical protein